MASAHGHLNNEVMNNNRPPAPKFRKWLMRNNKSSLSGLICEFHESNTTNFACAIFFANFARATALARKNKVTINKKHVELSLLESTRDRKIFHFNIVQKSALEKIMRISF